MHAPELPIDPPINRKWDAAIDNQNDTCDALDACFRELELELDLGNSTVEERGSGIISRLDFWFSLEVPDNDRVQQLRDVATTFAALSTHIEMKARRLAHPKAKTLVAS